MASLDWNDICAYNDQCFHATSVRQGIAEGRGQEDRPTPPLFDLGRWRISIGKMLIFVSPST
jgi:hypothetical protein